MIINVRSDQSMLDVCNGLNGNLNQLIEVMLQNNITDFVGNVDKSITFDSQNKVFTTFATSRAESVTPPSVEDALLLQDGFYLLQENGFKILL